MPVDHGKVQGLVEQVVLHRRHKGDARHPVCRLAGRDTQHHALRHHAQIVGVALIENVVVLHAHLDATIAFHVHPVKLVVRHVVEGTDSLRGDLLRVPLCRQGSKLQHRAILLMQNYLFAAAFQRHALICNIDRVLTDQSAAEHEAVQHVHVLHHAVLGQQIDHRVEGCADFSDAHIHILIVDAKDGVGAVLFQPDAVIRVPCGGLRRAAEGDGALRSFQLHRSAAVGIGQHRLRLRVSSLQRDLHIQLPPARPGGGAAPAPEHQLVRLGQQQAQVIQLVVFQRVHPHACQIAAAEQALVVAALRHAPVKGLHGPAQHLLLHSIRVQPHAL